MVVLAQNEDNVFIIISMGFDHLFGLPHSHTMQPSRDW